MEPKEQPTPDQLSQADIDWAVTYPEQKVEQIKEYCLNHPEANQQLLLEGHILDLVYGDFNGLFTGPLVIAAREPEPTRQILSARLDWMGGLPQTPQDLKGKIKKTVENLDSSTWETPEDLAKGEAIWKNNVQNEVILRISPGKKREELPLPIDPYREAWEEYWKFEHGRRREGGRPWLKPTR